MIIYLHRLTGYLVAGSALATALVASGAVPFATEITEVVISGGHETDPRDRGRPVSLVAAALGVPVTVFREAFSQVRPAPAGQEPDPQQVARNKRSLLGALAKYGVTNERLDEISDYYRYNARERRLWSHRSARIRIDTTARKITILDGGKGYTTPPVLTVLGHPEIRLTAKLIFTRDLEKNGAISSVKWTQKGP